MSRKQVLHSSIYDLVETIDRTSGERVRMISLYPDAKIDATAYVSSYAYYYWDTEISTAFDEDAETFWESCSKPGRDFNGIQCSREAPSKVLIRFDEPQEIHNFLLKKHSDIDISQKDYKNVCVSVPDPKMV